jgi:hypothetical protein
VKEYFAWPMMLQAILGSLNSTKASTIFFSGLGCINTWIPDQCGNYISLDFIGPLPVDNGFDCSLTITDQLHPDVCIIPTTTTLMAEVKKSTPCCFLNLGAPLYGSQVLLPNFGKRCLLNRTRSDLTFAYFTTPSLQISSKLQQDFPTKFSCVTLLLSVVLAAFTCIKMQVAI